MSNPELHPRFTNRGAPRWSSPAASIGFGSILLSLVWLTALTGARAAGEQNLRACRSDAKRYCATLDRTGSAERACLGQYSANLSGPCRIALEGNRQHGGVGDLSGATR